MTKLRVGNIGWGGTGRSDGNGYMSSKRYELVALAGHIEEDMEAYEQLFGTFYDYHPKHYVDARNMLDVESLVSRVEHGQK